MIKPIILMGFTIVKNSLCQKHKCWTNKNEFKKSRLKIVHLSKKRIIMSYMFIEEKKLGDLFMTWIWIRDHCRIKTKLTVLK